MRAGPTLFPHRKQLIEDLTMSWPNAGLVTARIGLGFRTPTSVKSAHIIEMVVPTYQTQSMRRKFMEHVF